MLKDFKLSQPTIIEFGKNKIKKLPDLLKQFEVKKVLFAYGKSSIKSLGLYDQTMKILEDLQIKIFHLQGIKPNPLLKTALKGAEMIKKNGIDFILAVGGGSVIDCCKAVSIGAYSKEPLWDHYKQFTKVMNNGDDYKPLKIQKAIPIGCILTLAATGSEANSGNVLSNGETGEKLVCRSELCIPVFAILDPLYTYTVSEYQTKAGCFDILSHLMELYFTNAFPYVIERLTEGAMKTIIYYLPIVIKDPKNYEARSNIMYTSTIALNGTLKAGRNFVGCCMWSHKLEHEVSAVFSDFTHGIGLSVIKSKYMEKALERKPDIMMKKLVNIGKNVFDMKIDEYSIENAKTVIKRFVKWQKDTGLPTHFSECLKEFDIKSAEKCTGLICKHFKEIIEKKKSWEGFTKEDVLEIYKKCL